MSSATDFETASDGSAIGVLEAPWLVRGDAEPFSARIEADREPWRRSEREWNHLEPIGLYGRRLRAPLLLLAAVIAAIPALVIALPVALVNAVLHGPTRVFFLQRRVGRRGRVFVIFKFRTMRDGPGGKDEAHVTCFGRFLRNTHLDELPQLVNVLRGDMALIGPRPEMVSVERWAAESVPGFSERLVLRPGITGLAQITQGYASGGDHAAYSRKLVLNRDYVDRVSPARDLAILGGTAIWMLRMRGWRHRETPG